MSVPDIVALAATLDPGLIVNLPGDTGASAFAVAAVNVGASASITVTTDTGVPSLLSGPLGVTLPISVSVYQTQSSGACLAPPTPSVTTTINSGATPTFSFFVQGAGFVPFDPATNRIFVRFKNAAGVTRGSTSVAVRTQ